MMLASAWPRTIEQKTHLFSATTPPLSRGLSPVHVSFDAAGIIGSGNALTAWAQAGISFLRASRCTGSLALGYSAAEGGEQHGRM
ncbi:hypothetical protein [Streptomyces sp. NPDC092129]|uniref:hypothetical protein n=1 Tax=Streptomyces sp. NPDC092129 TaxID=3366010 RepID=UPI0037F1C09F